MLDFSRRSRAPDLFRRALDKSLAIIELDPSGHVVAANERFCELFAYSRDEILGKHHSMFVDPAEAQTGEFQDFCKRLGHGESVTREFDVPWQRREGTLDRLGLQSSARFSWPG